MPEQASQRDLQITGANFEAPFQTEIYPYGLGGLNLKDHHDAIPVGQFARLTNLTHSMDRGLVARPGVLSEATGGTNHHTVRRLHDPQSGVDTRFWGIDQAVYRGLSGALASIDTGYSGNPLYLLPHRPPLSGDPWMFVADSVKMRKIRADGLVTPIGLPAPTVVPTVTQGTIHSKVICDFTGQTEFANWVPHPGLDRSATPVTSNPLVLTAFGDAPGTNGEGMDFKTDPGGVATTFYSFAGCHVSLDLTVFDDTVTPITDDDIIHLWMNMSHPALTEEMRIYLVVGPGIEFNDSVLPGTSPTENKDYYVKAFRQHDFSQAIQGKQALVDAAETARIRALRDQNLQDLSTDYVKTGDQQTIARVDPGRLIAPQSSSGAEEWVEFGIVDVPIRRSEWKRGGSTVGRDWSTVSGIIVYVSTTAISGPIAVRLADVYIQGGEGLDSSEPGSQSYDYRYTNYDPRTGAESNPSPIDTTTIDSLRRQLDVLPTAYGDGAIQQRIYRRGGTLIADWYFVGTNTGDGIVFTDTLSDDEIVTAGTVNLDHYQPVATIDDAGNTVLAQPVPVLFGPANGILFGLGDPYRPGHLYWCIPDQPDHWPVENTFEVCSPSEELMAGLMHAAQPFCFSRERLYAIYPNLTDSSSVTVTTTECRRGLVSRWGWAQGYGYIFGIAKDCIFATRGGVEEVVSLDIQPLFRGFNWNGYVMIDWNHPEVLRLEVFNDELYFLYQGQDGDRHVLVYSLLFKYWKAYEFGMQLSAITADTDTPNALCLLGGKTNGTTGRFNVDEFADLGAAISCTVRTGDWNLGRPREDKLLGDQMLDVNTEEENITLTNRLNDGTIENTPITFTAPDGRGRIILDSFGTIPQRARNISTEITWSTAISRPSVYLLGQSFIVEPDQTVNRMTQWDDLGHPDESYVTGVTFDCDTGGGTRTIVIERDFGGNVTTMATLTVSTVGRRKVKFSWADPITGHGYPCHKVRIRPDDECAAWILYRADWIAVKEPPRIARWDIHFEAEGDQYYTGLDLYCDTDGAEKQIVVEVDNGILTNQFTGEAFWRITTSSGREWVHLTLPWGRGHVFHFHAIDTNPGLLFKHKWFVAEEPSEQANWNQNFSPEGTFADKWFKAFLFEIDTFGQTKNVEVQLDGVTVETFTVNTTGRQIVHHALSTRRMGRVLRVFPVDGNPSRPYNIRSVFDEEPYQLDRWETEETDHGIEGFFVPIDAQITLRSTDEVRLTLSIYVNQAGTIVSDTYVIPSTDGVKDKRYVPFVARKGVLIRYVVESNDAFHLYEEESYVRIQPWGQPQSMVVHPFGNDDADPSRSMVISSLAASRSGGGAR